MSRELFEAFYMTLDESEKLHLFRTTKPFRNVPIGGYKWIVSRAMYVGWQAGEQSKQTEIDQLRAELAKAQVVPEYPMQPMQNKRFEANPIIEHFIEDLNAVAIWCQLNDIDGKYQEQLAQLIGYSLSGYGELSYVSDESYDRAVKSLQGETV